MKLDKNTFNPKLHKVTLRGKSVELVGFGIDKWETQVYYFLNSDNIICSAPITQFIVTEIKRFRVGLFTYGVSAVTRENWPYENSSDFIKWLTDWTEYDV